MLAKTSFIIAPSALALLVLSACQSSNAAQPVLEDSPAPHDAESTAVATPEQALRETVRSLATQQDLIGSHGSNYSYLDAHAAGNPLVIHETFSSRVHYKTLTPIIDTHGGVLFIDCTLIRTIEDADVVSVGNYCRGKSPASIEAIEDAVSDQWVRTYSTSLPWLDSAAAQVVDCEYPKGLEIEKHLILRCQDGESDETTSNVSTYVLSPSLEVELTMRGFEFSGRLVSRNTLSFWRLDDSSHELVEKVVR